MQHQEKIINLAKDFSFMPGGALRQDGPYSAENFREKHLVPALKQFRCVIVLLDGTIGYSSVFLVEAFGGLITKEGFKQSELKKKLIVRSNYNPILVKEVWKNINESSKNASVEQTKFRF